MKKFFITLLISLFALPCFAQNEAENVAVNVNIASFQQIKDIAKYNKKVAVEVLNAQTTTKVTKEYEIANERFEQSNVVAAYNEYEKLTRRNSTDFIKMMLAYELSIKGFFSLAQENFENIKDKQTWQDTISFIKQMYFPQKLPTKEEELKLAEYYTDIYYNNLPFESAKNLNKNTELLKKTDYAYFVLSNAYLESQEIFKAQNAINKAISLNKNNLNYKKYKAQILCEDKNFDEALKTVNNLISLSSPSATEKDQYKTLKSYILAQSKKDNSQSKYYLAKYLYNKNDIQRAIKEANASLFAQKKNVAAYNLLGRIYLNENNMFKSSENYQKAIKINKRNVDTLLGLANVEFYWDDFDKAIEEYIFVLKKEKNNEEALLNLSVCYTLKKDYKSAKSQVEKLLTINPYNYKAHYLLSFLDATNKEIHLKKTVAINPFFFDAWANLAEYSLQNGDVASAREYLFPLEYFSYKNFMYYYCVGKVAQIEGRFSDAQKAFEQCVNMCADFQPAKDILKELKTTVVKEKDTYDEI